LGNVARFCILIIKFIYILGKYREFVGRANEKEKRNEDLISLGTNHGVNHHHHQGQILVHTSCFNSWKGYSNSRMKLLKHPKEKCDKKGKGRRKPNS